MSYKRNSSTGWGTVFGTFVVLALATLALTGAVSCLTAAVVMLALGIGHSYAASCPNLGFLATWVILWALSLVAAAIVKGTNVNVNKES